MLVSKNTFCCIAIVCFFLGVIQYPCKAEGFELLFDEFQNALTQNDDRVTSEKGRLIYESLSQTYRGHTGFRAYQSKLKLAEHLTQQMTQHLRKATRAQVSVAMEDVFGEEGNPLCLSSADRTT